MDMLNVLAIGRWLLNFWAGKTFKLFLTFSMVDKFDILAVGMVVPNATKTPPEI